MSMIRTRLAALADRAALIDFIRDHWSAKHVFVHAPEVYDWQYRQIDDRLNIVLAEQVEDDGTATILGVLGFIPAGRFDSALDDHDILLALWKVRDDIAPPGLGLRLLKTIQTVLKPRMIGAIGISEMVGPIYRALGYTLGKLTQAAVFNPDLHGALRIASGIPDHAFDPAGDAGGYCLRQLSEGDADRITALTASSLPVKSPEYLNERYLRHPWYDYTLRGVIGADGGLQAIAVWRPVTCNGATILRIVDVIGPTDWLAHARALLVPELRAAGAEYIDLMAYGTDDQVMIDGGMISPDWVEGAILPNYFEPFEARNIPIKLSIKVFDRDETRPVRLYRADSDQDRPNAASQLSPRQKRTNP